MTWTGEFPHFFNVAMLFMGVMLLLKKAAQMDRYFAFRVAFFTLILACILIYCFLLYGFTFGNPPIDNCDPSEQHFCLTEM